MNKADYYYLKNLKRILEEKCIDENPRPRYKDGTPAYSYFITQVFEEYDISKNEFPITTLRNTAIKTGIKEILWIYQDQNSSLESAHKRNIYWWDEWNVGDNTIGQRYGATIKEWGLLDNVLTGLKNDPFSRRHIINMLQESDLRKTKGLYPCAYETMFSVRKINDCFYLDMTLNQRSNDYVMAGYINKIQYVALQMMVAAHLGYKVGKFCHLVQNLHMYDRHIEAAKEIISREPLNTNPKIEYIGGKKNFYDITVEDFSIINTEGIQKLKSPLEIAI
jgi:thymidylate synthase